MRCGSVRFDVTDDVARASVDSVAAFSAARFDADAEAFCDDDLAAVVVGECWQPCNASVVRGRKWWICRFL